MEHKISNELPPLPTEQLPANPAPNPEYQAPDTMTEKQSQQAVEAGISQPAVPAYQQPMTQTPASPQAVGQLPVNQQISTDPQTPIIADDSDLIEKEWVLKAKEIVARTKNDPYLQNKEVERMKADYMKKRYNKDIRVTED
jgi:hypothetical protein